MPEIAVPLVIRYAIKSDTDWNGRGARERGFAGPRLLVVADGLGGHAAGEVASAAAVDTLKSLDTDVPAGELLNVLRRAVQRANATLHGMVEADPSLRGMGTTLTGLLWSGSQLGIVASATRGPTCCATGGLIQITHDHTLVQFLIDDGRITPAQATSHPRAVDVAAGAGRRERGARSPVARRSPRRSLSVVFRRALRGGVRRCEHAGAVGCGRGSRTRAWGHSSS